VTLCNLSLKSTNAVWRWVWGPYSTSRQFSQCYFTFSRDMNRDNVARRISWGVLKMGRRTTMATVNKKRTHSGECVSKRPNPSVSSTNPRWRMDRNRIPGGKCRATAEVRSWGSWNNWAAAWRRGELRQENGTVSRKRYWDKKSVLCQEQGECVKQRMMFKVGYEDTTDKSNYSLK